MIDFELLAREWIKRARGERSQRALSKRLGYRSNVLYRWETGRAHPAASDALRMLAELGYDVPAALVRFYGRAVPWLERVDPISREGAAHLLDDLRGNRTFLQLAAASGYSRHQIARWLQSAHEPRLSEWLSLIQILTHRVLDLVAEFFGERSLPSVASQWQRLLELRRAAYDHPVSHLFLRALELEAYDRLPHHHPGFLAARLGLTPEQEAQSLALLEAAGQIAFEAGKWRLTDEPLVDTRGDPERSRKLRAHWLRHAADSVETGSDGVFSFNLFAISERDLAKARAIHARYYREMTELIRASRPSQRVVMFASQLYELDRR